MFWSSALHTVFWNFYFRDQSINALDQNRSIAIQLYSMERRPQSTPLIKIEYSNSCSNRAKRCWKLQSKLPSLHAGIGLNPIAKCLNPKPSRWCSLQLGWDFGTGFLSMRLYKMCSWLLIIDWIHQSYRKPILADHYVRHLAFHIWKSAFGNWIFDSNFFCNFV